MSGTIVFQGFLVGAAVVGMVLLGVSLYRDAPARELPSVENDEVLL